MPRSYYKCLITDKHHKYICSAGVDTEEEALDFVQAVNNNNDAAHFFTVNEVELNDDSDSCFVIRNILKDAIYVGRTVIN